MYAAHFAAGLAVKGKIPEAPTWALLTAAFLPDFLWVGLARAGIEPEYPPRGFFDDWSHSAVMILVWATVFAAAFAGRGRLVALGVWIAGMSHFFLDFLVHPARLALYPHSKVHLGWSLWEWGQRPARLGASHYWWVEGTAVAGLLALYGWFARRGPIPPRLVAASCCLVAGLHLLSA
jgi:hypothetical protein